MQMPLQIYIMKWWCKLGAVSIRKTVLLGMVIPMLKIRRPTGRLIFNMGIPIPGKTVFYIETGPRSYYLNKSVHDVLHRKAHWGATTSHLTFTPDCSFIYMVSMLMLSHNVVKPRFPERRQSYKPLLSTMGFPIHVHRETAPAVHGCYPSRLACSHWNPHPLKSGAFSPVTDWHFWGTWPG